MRAGGKLKNLAWLIAITKMISLLFQEKLLIKENHFVLVKHMSCMQVRLFAYTLSVMYGLDERVVDHSISKVIIILSLNYSFDKFIYSCFNFKFY